MQVVMAQCEQLSSVETGEEEEEKKKKEEEDEKKKKKKKKKRKEKSSAQPTFGPQFELGDSKVK
jgi:hypothetical protein